MIRLLTIPAALAGLLSVCVISTALASPPPPPPPPHSPPPPHIQLGIQFGSGGYDGDDYGDQCLSDREIYRDLRDDGYRFIQPVSDDDDTLTYDAKLGTRSYELTVDSCSGEVLHRHRIWHY